MTEAALLPCPHCGETEHLYRAYKSMGDTKPYAIDCLGCGTDFVPREGADVVAAWNRRHPPASREEGLRVKALGWDKDYGLSYKADGIGIACTVRAIGGGDWAAEVGGQVVGTFDGPGAAKAAAQADYEQRILSALIPTKPEAKEVMDEQPIVTALRDMEQVADPQMRRVAATFIEALAAQRDEAIAALQSKKPE